MKVRIEIDTKTFVRFWMVVIGFVLAFLAIYLAREALLIIGTALFIALALNRPVKSIATALPGKSRLGGTALAFASLIVLISAVVWFIIPPVVQQTAKLAESLPLVVDQVNEQWVGLADFIDRNGLRDQVDQAVDSIKAQASSWATSVGQNILSGVGSLASFLVSLFLVIVLSFLMLLEGPSWMQRIWDVYLDKEKMRHHKSLANKVYAVVTGYISGQLAVSGTGALLAGLCVFVLSLIFGDVEANLAMPTILITFLLSLIPMFGATLSGAIVGILLLLSSPTAAIIYIIYFIIYQQIENNFISPTIQAKQVELSALTVLVSVTIGLYLAGLIGGVIAIPIAGTVKVFVDDYLEKRRKSTIKQSKSLAQLVKRAASHDT